MTLQQALRANVRIEPGQKIRTFGGWCRHDRVLPKGAGQLDPEPAVAATSAGPNQEDP